MHMRFLSGIKEMKFKESEVVKLKDQSWVKEKKHHTCSCNYKYGADRVLSLESEHLNFSINRWK